MVERILYNQFFFSMEPRGKRRVGRGENRFLLFLTFMFRTASGRPVWLGNLGKEAEIGSFEKYSFNQALREPNF